MAFTSLETLVGTLERRPQWRSHQTFKQILDCWPQVVGDVVAVQTRPLSIRQHVLSVSTSSAAWSQNLAFQRIHILKKLTLYVPDHQLKDIRFSPAKWLELRKMSHGNTSPRNTSAGKKELKRYHFEQSEARSLWSYHPCKLPQALVSPSALSLPSGTLKPMARPGRSNLAHGSTHNAPTPSAPTPSAPMPSAPTTPVQTFHDWAAKIQKRSQRLPKCPRCSSPTPIGELKRWSVCSLCVSQDW